MSITNEVETIPSQSDLTQGDDHRSSIRSLSDRDERTLCVRDSLRESNGSSSITLCGDELPSSPTECDGHRPSTIIVTDMADDMICHHFDYADPSTPYEIRHCRGTIHDQDDVIICRSFGFTPEFPLSDETNIDKYVIPFLQNKEVFAIHSYEGTLLRVFYYKSKWYISTHKKIDAYNSKWGCDKSFGELFEQAFKHRYGINPSHNLQEALSSYLDTEHVYIFLLQNYIDNRIVCIAPLTPDVILLGHVENHDGHEFVLENKNRVLQIHTKEELINEVEKVDYQKLQGVILINPKTLECIKVIHNDYWDYYMLRNNQPSIIYRFIELIQLQNPTQRFDSFNQRVINKKVNDTCVDVPEVQMYMELYAERKHELLKTLHVLDDITSNIYRKYRNRFVRKQVTFVPQEQYYVLKELHELFLKSEKREIVTQDRVLQYLYSLPATRIFYLYSKYVERELETGHGNKVSQSDKEKINTFIYKNELI